MLPKVEGNVGYYKHFLCKYPYARSDTAAAQTRATRTHLHERQYKIPDIALQKAIGMTRQRVAQRGHF